MTPDLEDFERQAEEELRQWSEQLEADAPRLQAEMDATIRSWESHRGTAMTCHSPTGDLIQLSKCLVKRGYDNGR
jgi:hypothetical protein